MTLSFTTTKPMLEEQRRPQVDIMEITLLKNYKTNK